MKRLEPAYLFALGHPFSPLYGGLMRLRAWSYRAGLLTSRCMPAPVISVGNLVMGGSGKTPVVQHVARLLQAHGLKPAVISRGYGGRATGPVNVVSDGASPLLDAAAAGDEPRLLAETLPGVPVLTGRRRHLPAAEALRMGVDALVLDDGFQHLALRRDVDLVLFNTERLGEHFRVFPGGMLREPVSALARATAFVLTDVREDNRARAEAFATRLRRDFPGRSVHFAGFAPESLLTPQARGGVIEQPLEAVRALPGPVFAFCGIAGPQSFFRTLTALSLPLAGTLALPDHHAYTAADAPRLSRLAQEAGAAALLTTEKDLVKLGPLAAALPLSLHALRMRVSFDADFDAEVLRAIGAAADRHYLPI